MTEKKEIFLSNWIKFGSPTIQWTRYYNNMARYPAARVTYYPPIGAKSGGYKAEAFSLNENNDAVGYVAINYMAQIGPTLHWCDNQLMTYLSDTGRILIDSPSVTTTRLNQMIPFKVDCPET